MKTTIKLVILVVVLLVALAVAGLGAAFFYSNQIARTTIEKGATYALQVPTTVGSVRVGIVSGQFGLGDLTVANPEGQGFKSPHFLALDDGGVAVTWGTLRKEVVELPTFHLHGIDVQLERANGKSNYKIVLDNLKHFEGGSSSEPKPSSGASKKFVIRRVEVKDVNAHVSLLPIGGDLTKVDVHVPEIVLTDVGKGGVPMGQLVNVLTQAIIQSVIEVGGNRLPTEILGDLKGQLAQLTSLDSLNVEVLNDAGKKIAEFGSSTSDAIKDLSDTAEDATKAAKDAVDDLGESAKGISDLFKKKDDK